MIPFRITIIEFDHLLGIALSGRRAGDQTVIQSQGCKLCLKQIASLYGAKPTPSKETAIKSVRRFWQATAPGGEFGKAGSISGAGDMIEPIQVEFESAKIELFSITKPACCIMGKLCDNGRPFFLEKQIQERKKKSVSSPLLDWIRKQRI